MTLARERKFAGHFYFSDTFGMRKKNLHPTKTMDELLEECRQLQTKGATSEDICRHCDGLGPLLTIKVLRSLWPHLSLVEAKDIFVRYDTGMSLHDYQGKLGEELEAIIVEEK